MPGLGAQFELQRLLLRVSNGIQSWLCGDLREGETSAGGRWFAMSLLPRKIPPLTQIPGGGALECTPHSLYALHIFPREENGLFGNLSSIGTSKRVTAALQPGRIGHRSLGGRFGGCCILSESQSRTGAGNCIIRPQGHNEVAPKDRKPQPSVAILAACWSMTSTW